MHQKFVNKLITVGPCWICSACHFCVNRIIYFDVLYVYVGGIKVQQFVAAESLAVYHGGRISS